MSPEAAVLGWDLGGAHLKVVRWSNARGVEGALQLPCPLWRGEPHLEAAVAEALERLGAGVALHALTMTGELVDLYPGRAEGVRRLVALMAGRLPPESLRVYAGPEGFLAPAAAVVCTRLVASANWHASAALAARRLPAGLLVDVGSTTSDLLPFAGGRVLARGYTDHERQARGELIYAGVVRTPVMALCREAPVGGEWTGLAAEHFATTADVYRLTGELPEGADQHPAADGGEKSRAGSRRRLARMVGLDGEDAGAEDWAELAAYLRGRQLDRLERACRRLLSRGGLAPDAPLVGAGTGRFLVRRLAGRLERPWVDFGTLLPLGGAGAAASDCAPAAAVAVLATLEAA